MRLQIVSDVHLDENRHADMRDIVRNDLDADALVVAGDVAHGYAHGRYPGHSATAACVRRFERHVSDRWRHSAVCLGNHDFYHGPLPDAPGSELELGGVPVLSTPLFSAVPPREAGCRSWVDLRHIRGSGAGGCLTAAEYHGFHLGCVEWLDDRLSRTAARTVVVTHHLPLEALVSDEWRGSDLNFWFASDLRWLVEKHAGRIALWVHGHSHDRVDATLLGVRFVRNPVGYLRHGEGAGHSTLVVDV